MTVRAAPRLLGLALALGLLLACGAAGAGAATNPWRALGATAPAIGSCGKQAEGSVRGAGVHDILRVGNELYVAGCFVNWAGIPEADYVAKWNGAMWSALGSNGSGDGAFNRVVYDLELYQDSIVAGGEFTNAAGVAHADMIAKWDGIAWSALPRDTGASLTSPRAVAGDYVSALYADGSDLYVGGSFPLGIGETGFTVSGTENFARWNGAIWASMGAPTVFANDAASRSMVPQAIVKVGTDIVVGSAHYSYVTCAISSSCFDDRRPYALVKRSSGGIWSADLLALPAGQTGLLGSGFGVFALATDPISGLLHVGGNFLNAGGDPNADYLVARLPGGAIQLVSGFAPTGGTGAVISDIAVTGSGLSTDVYVAGSFPSATPNIGSSAVAVRSAVGGTWRGLGSAPIGSNPVDVAYAIALDLGAGDIYLGGPFADAGGVAAADAMVRFRLSSRSGYAVAVDSGEPDYTPVATLPTQETGVYTYLDDFQTATADCTRTYTVTPDDLGTSMTYTVSGGGGAVRDLVGNRLAMGGSGVPLPLGDPVEITFFGRSSDGVFATQKLMRVTCTRSQTITFAAIADQVVTTGTLALSATASSALTPTYTSSTTSVCTVAGSTVTLVAAGTCTITAAQAGDGQWAAAPTVTRSFQVTAAPRSSTPPADAGAGGSGSGSAAGSTSSGGTAASAAVSVVGPAAPRLGKVTVRAGRATVVFTAAAGVSYSLSATSGKRARRGTCAVKGAKGTCSVRLVPGVWLLAVTPTQAGIAGAPATRRVKAR